MEVGDLVTLSAKAKKLQWIEKVTRYNYRDWPHYGVIVEKHRSYGYCVHWFYNSGEQRGLHSIFERTHLKRFK